MFVFRIRRPPISTRTVPLFPDTTRVRSAEDLVFVDRRGLGVLLERAVRTGFRDCAILAAADHQEWPAAGVVIYCSGAEGREVGERSEGHTSELQSPMRISSAVFCLKTTNSRWP